MSILSNYDEEIYELQQELADLKRLVGECVDDIDTNNAGRRFRGLDRLRNIANIRKVELKKSQDIKKLKAQLHQSQDELVSCKEQLKSLTIFAEDYVALMIDKSSDIRVLAKAHNNLAGYLVILKNFFENK